MGKGTCRFGGRVSSFLLCMLWAMGASASPAVGATTSTPTIVSFGTLPALQVATPKPGTHYVQGDFDGDGTSDLLWFNPSLSQVGYWTMKANPGGDMFSQVVRTGISTYNVTPGYFVGAVGDFNNDGFADLVFTSAHRDLWLWTNDQHGHWQSTEIGTYPDQWQLIGAGDIDGDGYDDLLWLDPSECKFAYWTMHGAVRTGYRIVDVTCGYYPVGIGYYQPSNRLSILWTSAAHDLYVWDSKAAGFVSYRLQLPLSDDFQHIWAFGGGYMGNSIGVQYYAPYSNSQSGAVAGGTFSRVFDADGNQTGFTGYFPWSGGGSLLGSGGYLLIGNDVNTSALYGLGQAASTLTVNPPALGNASFAGPGGELPGYTKWSYPVGWWIVGAPANGVAPPPWQ